MVANACHFLKGDGTRCSAPPLREGDFCLWHSPEHAAEVAEGRRLGARRATLEVRAGNTGARRLYERLGFYTAGTRRNYYTNPVEDALILWRDDPAGPPKAASGSA